MWYTINNSAVQGGSASIEQTLRSFVNDSDVWDHMKAMPLYGTGWQLWADTPEVWDKIANSLYTVRIRNNYGPMPFDRCGVHATGREILMNFSGITVWSPEYEDDPTVDLPCTDPDAE